MADTSIADVNEQMRRRIAQQLMFNNPGLAGGDASQYGGYEDLPLDALSQRASPFTDPNYFPSNSGVPNPAVRAIEKAIGPQVSEPRTPQGFEPPGAFETGSGQDYSTRDPVNTPWRPGQTGWTSNNVDTWYPQFDPSYFSPNTYNAGPSFPYQPGGTTTVPQQPSGSTSQSQQNPMTQYMQEYRQRYGSDISPNDPYLQATFPNFYGSGGSTNTQMPSSTYFDPTPTAGNNFTPASDPYAGLPEHQRSYAREYQERYNRPIERSYFDPGGGYDIDYGVPQAISSLQQTLRMIDEVNPPQQALPNQTSYMQPGLDPRQQSYANEYQTRYRTALDPSYFTSGQFERDYPTQPAAPPPSGDTLTPADRGINPYAAFTPAQQSYAQQYQQKYGSPLDPSYFTSGGYERDYGSGGQYTANPAYSAPAAPSSGGIPDYARPYHTGDVAHTPWLPGQVGWLSEGNYWYPDFGPNIPTQQFTSYPAQSPVPGAPSSGGGTFPGGGYSPGGGGGGGGDFQTPGYTPGGGLAPGPGGGGGGGYSPGSEYGTGSNPYNPGGGSSGFLLPPIFVGP